MKFPYITQFKKIAPKKKDFEADPINKIKTFIIKTSLFDFKINSISLCNAIQKIAK